MNFLESIFGDTFWTHVASASIIVLIGYLFGIVLKLFLRFLIHRIAERTKSVLDELLLDVARQRIVGLAFLVSGYIAAQVLHAALLKDGIPIPIALRYVEEGFYILLVLTITFTISRLIDAVVRWYLHEVASKTETRLDDELAPFINRILNILVFVIGVIIILDHFNQNISSLVVSLGVGSLAVALAAQDTLANMIAGFVLMVDRPFRVGDRIKLPNGVIGNVSQIGIRSTKVINDNDIMIITPNAEIVKSQISNLSYPNDIVRFDVDFSIAYGTELEMMSKTICETVNRQPDVVEHDRTEVRIIKFSESGIDCQLFVRIKDPKKIPRKYSDMLRLIYATLGEADIEIPFPQRVLHLSQMDEKTLHEFSKFPGKKE